MRRLPVVVSLLACSACHATSHQRQPPANGLPAWVDALIEQQPSNSRLVIEESTYQGHRAFLVMPGDRGFDTGNEHVLHSDDGHIICEFGGFVGEVTAGSCDINGIKYVRTIFGKSGT